MKSVDLYFQGHVILKDSTLPISSVSMELICVFQSEVCKTTQETRTHRDSDGRTHHTTETVYHYYPYTLELLHTPRADIFDSRSIGGTVFTSPASIPFAVQMPINMPSTLETEGCALLACKDKSAAPGAMKCTYTLCFLMLGLRSPCCPFVPIHLTSVAF